MSSPASGSAVSARISEILAAHAGREGPLLPILHDIQEEFGFVPEESDGLIAAALSLTRAEVHGVISFYHDFRKAPAGRHVLKICRAEACQAMGAEALGERARKTLGLDWGETSKDGRVTLEPIFCLGLCACAPAAMLDGELKARLSAASLDALIEEARS